MVSAAPPAAYRPCTTPTHPRPLLVLCRTPAGEGFLLGLDWDPAVRCSPLQDRKTVLDVAKDKKHAEEIIAQSRRRYVIADVLQQLAEEEDAELRLDRRRPTEGLPWEVKDCDGMNPMEHAHGQSDFQRIFANCKKGSLWLFTRDKVAPSQHGRQNFAVFCEQVLVHSADRYNEVILARRQELDDEVPCDKADALQRVVLARWDAESRQVMWQPQLLKCLNQLHPPPMNLVQ